MGFINYILNSDSRKSLKKLNKLALKVEALEPKYQAMSDEELKGQTKILKDRLAAGETLDDILFDAFAALREASWRVLKMKHFHVQIVGGICLHQGRIAEMKTGEGKTLVSTLPAYLNALTGKGVHIVTVNDYLAKRDAEWMGKVHKFMGLTVGVVVPGMDDEDKKKAYQCDIIYGTNNELGFDYLRDNLKTSIAQMVQRELNFCIIDEVDSILIDEARTPLIISGRGDKSSELYQRADAFVRTLDCGEDDQNENAIRNTLPIITRQIKEQRRKVELSNGSEEQSATLIALEEKLEFANKMIEVDDMIDALDDQDASDKELKKVEKVVNDIEKSASALRLYTEWNGLQSKFKNKKVLIESWAEILKLRKEAKTAEQRAILEEKEMQRKLNKQKYEGDYNVDRKEKTVVITESGARKAEEYFGIKSLADIENADLNHHIQQALKAHHIFHNGEEYIVSDEGEILIVDEFTGRVLNGRRYSDGLHQAIEAKEHVTVKEENKTNATVTFQNYFRLYNKLSGMTGTAKTEEDEFRTIYSLDVVQIPTNRPVKRIDYADMIYATVDGKKKAIVNEIVERHEKGQPILIGTVTVEKSEEIARLLRRNGIKHNILNARNHEREAEIVAQAGRFGAVTIATNMAGRGTDILLGGNPEYLAKKRMREEGFDHDMIETAISYADREFTDEEMAARNRYAELYDMYKAETDAEKQKVIEAGGLCILGTERHESRRIDNQLRGRSGRQGDPGESVFLISLEDDLAKRFGGESMKKLYNVFKIEEDQCLQSKMLSRGIENAQKAIEGRNFGIRKHTLQYDEVMNEQRKTIYGERMKVLKGENIHEQMLKYIPDYIAKVLSETVNIEAMPEKWDEKALNEALKQRVYPDECTFEVTREMLEKWDYQYALDKLTKEVVNAYELKISNIGIMTGGQVDFYQIERNELLRAVDTNWIDHIDAMDQLRKGIGLRGYAQQDPVIAYKQEGYDMFMEMIDRIQTTTISRLLKGRIIRVDPSMLRPQPRPVPQAMPAPAPVAEQAEPQAEESVTPQAPEAPIAEPAPAPQPVRTSGPAIGAAPQAPSGLYANIGGKALPKVNAKSAKVGPNDPCPCGSGKKYKKCCYWKDHK